MTPTDSATLHLSLMMMYSVNRLNGGHIAKARQASNHFDAITSQH